MTTDFTTRTPSPAVLTDRTLIRIGAGFATAAGALRLPSSFIDPDASSAAIDALYDAIDISLLFAAITAFGAVPTSRTRLGTAGFTIAVIGTGLLIGPEPTETDIEYYAIGATAVTVGFALLAIAWRHSSAVSSSTRRAFVITVAIGLASGVNDLFFFAAGLTFAVGLLALAHDLRRMVRFGDGGST